MEIINLILSSLIVVITPLIFVKIVLNCNLRRNKKAIIIATIISMIMYIFTYKYTTGIYKTILSFIIHIILIYNFYEISFNKSIVSMIFFIIMLIIPEFSILALVNIFELSTEYFYTSFAGSLLSNIIVLSTMIPITFLLKRILRKIINMKININNKIAIFSILTLVSILVFFYDVIANFRIGSKIIFYIIAIITFINALIIVIYQENKNSKLKIEYNKLLEFMETYEVELEKQRIIKHEYKNQLITIKSKIIDKDKKNKIIDYINNLLGDNTKFNQEEYTKLQYLPANGIKALFYFKIAEAKNKGIKISVNISSNIKDSTIKNLTTKEFKDLGILIGVYLDNAIEASLRSENKLLGIEMYHTTEGVKMIISNSYKGNIEETKIGKMPFSTKGKGRGYGLMLANNTIINNKIFKNSREITNNLYMQIIVIKK